jgi:DNA-binding NarL/FixJ family response regulator
MKRSVSIIVADDHEFYRDGLVAALESKPEYKILAACHDGTQLVADTARLKPEIVLTDLRMPLMSGVDAIKEIKKIDPAIHCLALSTFDNEFMIVEALEAGAQGYITKSMPRKELFDAITSLMRGLPYYCQTTSHKLVRMIAGSYFNPYSKDRKGLFSDTEKEVIKLICQDKSVKEMADVLCMSVRTVENHRARVFKKMDVKTTAGVAILPLRIHCILFMTDFSLKPGNHPLARGYRDYF